MVRNEIHPMSLRVCMLKYFLPIVFAALALLPAMARAQNTFPNCAGANITVVGLPTSLPVQPGTLQGTPLGNVFTVKVTLTSCTGGTGPNPQIQLWTPFGTTDGAGSTGATGITYRAAGPGSFTTSGTCNTPRLIQSATQTALYLDGTLANCTATLTVPASFYLGSSRIVGTQSIVSATPASFTYGAAGYCSNPPGCTATTLRYAGSGATSSGIFSIPVYVLACAGGVANGTQTVQLPKVSASAFKGAAPVAKTGFQITLQGCQDKASNWEGVATNAGYDAYVSWSFTACGGSSIICNSGTSNVRVQILTSDGITAVDSLTPDVHALSTGTTVLQYYAAYLRPASGQASPGSVSAQATLTLSYR